MSLSDEQVKDLELKAVTIRESIVGMLVAAGSGHTAGPLGMADIFTAMYFHILNHDTKRPDWPLRDRLVLSNGHIVPVRYAAMAHAGYFPVDELLTLRKFGSRLQGHPERHALPGLETTSGPLGSGLSQAAGIALGLRMDEDALRAESVADGQEGRLPHVFCCMSDGELDEGNSWEAIMFAGNRRLSNLTAIIDRNNIQIDGMTEDTMPLEPLADKWRAFNWHVIEIDGHHFGEIVDAVNLAKAVREKPTVIIAHTIPGKGITEIEFDYRWHGTPPGSGPEDVWKKADQAREMMRELRTLQGRIEGGHVD